MVDSNFATNKDTRKSVSGIVSTLGGCIIGWVSKTQKSSALSSTKAKYYALALATQDLLFTQNLMIDMGIDPLAGVLFEDNFGAIQLVQNCQAGTQTKHIDN